jgi:hypothetical protein
VALRTPSGDVHLLTRSRDNWLASQMLDVMKVGGAEPWPAPGAASADGALACDATG